MYKVKRMTKLFGLTKSSKYKNWEKINSKGKVPEGTILEDTHTSLKVNYKWSNVDKYRIITDSPSRNFKDNYKFINKEARKGNEVAKELVSRIDKLLNDLKGNNKSKTQYVTTDNPNTPISDCTHMLAKLNSNGILVYSKNIDDEHRLVYEIHKPKKVNNEMVSDVVIDDINDHTYKGVTYEGLLRRTQTDPETGETIIENQPSFKYRHRSKQYSDEENEE